MQPALIIIILAVIIAYFIITYKPKQEDDLKDLYSEGLDLMVDGYKQGAYENFKKIISQDTTNIKAYIKLGQVIREGGNPENALKIHIQLNYRKNLSFYEKKELYKNIALDYFSLNKIDESIIYCKKILEIDIKNNWSLSKLIQLYQMKKDWFNSKKYLELKLQYSGEKDSRLLALYKLQEGRNFLNQKNFEESRDCFNESVKICDSVAIAYYFIGNSYSQESDSFYKYAESIKVTDADSQKEHDENISKAKDLLNQAISMWVNYANLKPESSWMVIHLLKDALFALDRYNEIETILKEILNKDSDNVDVIASLADYYDHLGDSASALDIIDQGLKKDDSSLLVRLIRLKLLASNENSKQNDIKKNLDILIKSLVEDSDYQIYKNTSTDNDALWLYSMSNNKEID